MERVIRVGAVVVVGLLLTGAAAGGERGVRVQVLALNDVHGHLEPPAGASGRVGDVPAGGIAYLATHIARLERGVEHSWVVGAGDMIGGSPLVSGLFDDDPTIEALGRAGLDITSVGNHEFDAGPGALRRHVRAADFDYLGANVLRDGEPIVPTHRVVETGGVKLAFIGVTLQGTPLVTRPDGVTGLEFRPEVQTVNRLVRRLRGEGIEAFVALVHEGGVQAGDDPNGCADLRGPIVPIAEGLDDAVDVVASAHTHRAYVCEVDGKVVTSAASYGRLITELDLTLSPRTGDVTDVDARNVVVTRDVRPDPALTRLVERYARRAAPTANRVVGTVAEDLSRAELGPVIAAAFAKATGADAGLMNPGGIRGELAAGEVTFGDLYEVLPFSDTLVVQTLSGAQLAALADEGLYLSSTAIDPTATYEVAMTSFLAAGGDGFAELRAGTARREAGLARDAVEAYL